MSTAIDRYRQACAAVHEANDDLNTAAGEAWHALPLGSKLRVLLGFAVWEIELAAGAVLWDRRRGAR
jgi:hypothetical protein